MRLLFAFSCFAATAACVPGDGGTNAEKFRDTPTFGAEDKRVARHLSIGSRPDLMAGSAFDKAQMCSVAIETLVQELRQSNVLSSEQLKAVKTKRAQFDRQANALGARDGKTQAEILENRRALLADEANSRQRLQVSLSCLQTQTS